MATASNQDDESSDDHSNRSVEDDQNFEEGSDDDGDDNDNDDGDKQDGDDNDDDEQDDDDDDDDDEQEDDDDEQDDDDDEQDDGQITKESGKNNTKKASTKPKRKVHKLSLTEVENFTEKLKRRGVIYIARIPPKMTPTKVKTLLSEFGEVTRVYLVEEDPTVRKRRKKEFGNSGGKRYIEGWIEFADKKVAKHIAQSLNNTSISNHKRNPHYGDLWNLKYLHKFKWSHLTEKVAYERRVREQKLRIEMLHARRENASYVHRVEMGKTLDKIEERRKKNNADRKRDKANDGDDDDDKKRKRQKRRTKHHQTKPLSDGADQSAKRIVLGGLV